MDDPNGTADGGGAFVYERINGNWQLQQRLEASDGAVADYFGRSVAIDGETIVVGSYLDDVGAGDQGSAYVYSRSGTVWHEQAKLTASDGAASDWFGESVDVSGDTIGVGAHLSGAADLGAAYVFNRSGTSWSEQAKLTASDGAASDWFGYSVAIDDDTVAIGAYLDDGAAGGDQGSAYVFTRSGTTWSEEQQLTASDGAASDWFGTSVDISGDTIAVGSQLDDAGAGDSGSGYVFTRSGSTWSEQQKIQASDGAGSDWFGHAIAVDGDTVLSGAYLDDVDTRGDQGSFYSFERSGTTWSEEQKVSDSGHSADYFGYSVAVSGDTAIVGAYLADENATGDPGGAFVFTREDEGTIWRLQQRLSPTDIAAGDRFGYAVDLDGDTAIVGSYLDDIGLNGDQGAAYIFTRNNSTWSEQAKLTASDGLVGDYFGEDVAISGDSVVIGSYLNGVIDEGAAYVFTRSGTTWSEEQKIEANDGAAVDYFGSAVDIDGDLIVVGSLLEDSGIGDGGSA